MDAAPNHVIATERASQVRHSCTDACAGCLRSARLPQPRLSHLCTVMGSWDLQTRGRSANAPCDNGAWRLSVLLRRSPHPLPPSTPIRARIVQTASVNTRTVQSNTRTKAHVSRSAVGFRDVRGVVGWHAARHTSATTRCCLQQKRRVGAASSASVPTSGTSHTGKLHRSTSTGEALRSRTKGACALPGLPASLAPSSAAPLADRTRATVCSGWPMQTQLPAGLVLAALMLMWTAARVVWGLADPATVGDRTAGGGGSTPREQNGRRHDPASPPSGVRQLGSVGYEWGRPIPWPSVRGVATVCALRATCDT